MVMLDKIYTRSGDDGETSLAGGKRVPKHDLRVETYGTVDEANSFIGVARLYTDSLADLELGHIQNDLFDLGADLAKPHKKNQNEDLRISSVQIYRLETKIDVYNEKLAPLDSFVLPGGSKASALLHEARRVVRRAERLATKLSKQEQINSNAIVYLNRLSDYLFVLARHLNENGLGDVLWEPGANIGKISKEKI